MTRPTIEIDFPFQIGGNGRTSITDEETHIQQLIEQILFTMPGERVNRPTFGSDVSKMLFAPNSAAAAPALQLAVQGALLQYLGDRIIVNSVDVESLDATLKVTIRYLVRATQENQVVELTRRA